MFENFLEELKQKEILINFSKGKLKYSGAEQNIDNELIAKLVKYKPKLLNHFWPEDCPNMMPLNTEGQLTPFFLLHGGSFFELSEYLGNSRPLYSFLFIGSGTEEKRYKRLEDFASDYQKQLINIRPNGPYLFGGMSMGGHLAFQIAIELQEKGEDVPFLVMVDSALPFYEPPIYYKQWHKRFFHKVYNWLKDIYCDSYTLMDKIKYDFLKSNFLELPIGERTQYIVRLYEQLIRKYKPKTEFKGKILLFRASGTEYNSEYLGWDSVCNNVTVVNYNGSHGSMFSDVETIELIKSNISEWLEKYK